MDQKQFVSALSQIVDEKGISQERVVETIEMAIAAAYKREYGKRGQIIRAKLNQETGASSFTQVKLVVDPEMLKTEEEIEEEEKMAAERMAAAAENKEVEGGPGVVVEDGEEEKKIRFNPEKHILLEDAKKENPDIQIDDEFIVELPTFAEFGRIAAQTAKQVIIQRIREAERDAIFAEFKEKEGELLSGIVQRLEGRTVFVDLGKTIATLFLEEQIPSEHYRIGQRLRFLLLRVEMTPKGPMVLLSRSHPSVLRKLFELEVPEIAAETVEIKSIAREGGSRTKLAVTSNEEGIDPIGSCVGQRGTRVQTVINEIGGEKIDIIEWSENPEVFIAHALSPAKVLDVTLDEKERKAVVEVPPDQLSLAIGQKGQNVRLAAKLTGWKIDIKGADFPQEADAVEETEEVEPSKESESGKDEQAESKSDVENENEPQDDSAQPEKTKDDNTNRQN